MRRWIANIWNSIAGKARLDRDLDEELQAYLEESIERKRHAGMDPETARQAARAELGGVQA
jgi:hypothetical protein